VIINLDKNKIIKETLEFIIPFILGIGIISFTGFFIVVENVARYFGLVSAYFFPPLGKESVIPIGIGLGFHPLIMALTIAFVDIIVALFLVWNFDFAKKIPFVGGFIDKIEKIGENSSNKYGWIKPLRFIGIVLFVMVPFQGSGGLVGSIVGRLIGMNPKNTFFAITTGAIIGCCLIAYFTDTILELFNTNFMQALLIVIILLIVGFMIFVYRKTKNNNNKKNQKK
jgi:uncharacterized membrane protein